MLDPRLGFFPLKLCSFNAAVRRLRRLICPHVVQDTRPSAPSLTNLPIARRPVSPVCGSSNAPRLQGFAPHQSLPLRVGC